MSVRGDFERPAVLREVRRLADFLRAQPGVDSAWSVADLFFGIALGGGDVSRVPETPGAIGVLLDQARGDPAVALELAPDHREGLVVARFDDDPPADRLAIHDRLEHYLRTELRSALIEVDLVDPHLPLATRLLGKGVLAGDARERIVRICARSGRPLNDGEIASVGAVHAPGGGACRPRISTSSSWRSPRSCAISCRAGTRRGAHRAHGGASARGSRDEIGSASVDASIDDLRRTLAAHLGAQLGEERVTRARGGDAAAPRVCSPARRRSD